ncbi:hypothetical protein [Frigoriglobus tundricola]|uniref:Uncharacterized protein n=1 Tax=Frigoriglobus tundricola TaxID=2774151 RepID=A0A6M5Z248_9BACT|nr:hypothetical protein [Frigoriglobus tundricola]QJX00470.1 hypothetical protein FTUN_8100 [Frigoriglobus tundricola]
MRKMLLALGCVLFLCGLAAAVDVTLLKFDKDKKTVTVKEGAAESVYKITETTRFLAVDPDGHADTMSYDDAVKGLGSPKAERAMKFGVVVKDGAIMEMKLPARKRR